MMVAEPNRAIKMFKPRHRQGCSFAWLTTQTPLWPGKLSTCIFICLTAKTSVNFWGDGTAIIPRMTRHKAVEM